MSDDIAPAVPEAAVDAPDAAPPEAPPEAPSGPDGWEIAAPELVGGVDAEVNRRLHAAGFDAAQAQLVYDLAGEYLAPLVQNAAAELEAERQTDRLVRQFGGQERWEAVARELRSWGRANLPGPAYEALSASYDGCMAMHRMMRSGEPSLSTAPGGGETSLDDLKSAMRDPRYWRERDPGVVARVTEGFRRLYGGA